MSSEWVKEQHAAASTKKLQRGALVDQAGTVGVGGLACALQHLQVAVGEHLIDEDLVAHGVRGCVTHP